MATSKDPGPSTRSWGELTEESNAGDASQPASAPVTSTPSYPTTNDAKDDNGDHDVATTPRNPAHFYVYCSHCTNAPGAVGLTARQRLKEGKLRVRCSSCKSGAITLDRDPASWSDVLEPNRISGDCQELGCKRDRRRFRLLSLNLFRLLHRLYGIENPRKKIRPGRQLRVFASLPDRLRRLSYHGGSPFPSFTAEFLIFLKIMPVMFQAAVCTWSAPGAISSGAGSARRPGHGTVWGAIGSVDRVGEVKAFSGVRSVMPDRAKALSAWVRSG
ncbi:unnamed protein product [Nesidiocoris tenuis]|uniref:Parkin RING/Ubox like zinc-binding domain-containing protein n=1 Tax=Nesidiocoris tenuis TaxID=355587 RepID=A0A6H5HGA6_9HEMI|nr:unnamed protein product [Nesidiocoris tenuis]